DQGSYLYVHLGAFANLVDVVLRNISSHVHVAEVDDTEELHLPGSYYLPLFSHPLIDYSVKWGPDDTALYLRPHLLYRVLQCLIIGLGLQVLDLRTYLLLPEPLLPLKGGPGKFQLGLQAGKFTGQPPVVNNRQYLSFPHILPLRYPDLRQDPGSFRVDDDVLISSHIPLYLCKMLE